MPLAHPLDDLQATAVTDMHSERPWRPQNASLAHRPVMDQSTIVQREGNRCCTGNLCG